MALTGPSGSGKTQLLRSLADLDPSEGEVILNSYVRSEQSAPEWRRRLLYVPAQAGWYRARNSAAPTGGKIGIYPPDCMAHSSEKATPSSLQTGVCGALGVCDDIFQGTPGPGIGIEPISSAL